MLLESLTEIRHVQVLLARELLEGALQLLLRHGQPQRRGFRLDQLLVDELLEPALEQLIAILVALRAGRLVHDARELRSDALLDVGEQDRLSIDDGGDALLELRAGGGGAQETGGGEEQNRNGDEAFHARSV